jgi:rubredoxin
MFPRRMAMPGKCVCGAVTDWIEVGSTWICRKCGTEEIKKSMDELRGALEKMEWAERSLSSMKVDTLALPILLGSIKKEIKKIKSHKNS